MNLVRFIPTKVRLVLVTGAALLASACAAPIPIDAPQAPSAGSGPPMGAAAIQGTVWIANEVGNSLTVIDAATNEVVTTLTNVEGPHNVQVAPDGKRVWAVSGHESLALAIDPETYTLRGAVSTGAEPAHVVITPSGETVYVTNSGEDSVTVIDTQTLQAVATIPVGQFPHGLRPSPDGQWVAVANLRGNTVRRDRYGCQRQGRRH